MRSFVLHMGGKALTWFVGLDKGMISSFVELVETLCNHWDSGCCEEWIPFVKHVKCLFTKESQIKDQFEASIVQGLTDDILSTIDEASQANEYDGGSIYEYTEVLVEKEEDRISSPFQHRETYNEKLDLWEHNDENSEDDGY